MPDFTYELSCKAPVAGVDEAGRGPLAGPVVAAAVILPQASLPGELLENLNDSKKLSARKRDVLFDLVMQHGQVGVGLASVSEIDEINILQATFLSMRRAVLALDIVPGHVLIDGNKLPSGLPAEATAIVKGDGKSLSIAAASIIAKVTRDRIMQDLDLAFPGYGWAKNAGYGTKQHREALESLGVTEHHRKSFAPISQMTLL